MAGTRSGIRYCLCLRVGIRRLGVSRVLGGSRGLGHDSLGSPCLGSCRSVRGENMAVVGDEVRGVVGSAHGFGWRRVKPAAAKSSSGPEVEPRDLLIAGDVVGLLGVALSARRRVCRSEGEAVEGQWCGSRTHRSGGFEGFVRDDQRSVVRSER